MTSENMYKPPESSVELNGSNTGLEVTEKVLTSLGQTGPWVRFMSILSFIGIGFMILGGIGVLAGATSAPAGSGGIFVAGGLLYLVVALVMIIPSVYLFKYASAIKRIKLVHDTADLEAAITMQKSFWKFMGIFAIVYIVLGIIALIGIMSFGINMMGMQPGGF